MPEQRPVLDHYRNLVADRMTSVLGLSEALQGGSLASPTEEQRAAIETLRESARRLRADLDGLRSAIQKPLDTAEIGHLIQESLQPLTQMARQGIGLELTLPPAPVRVRTGWLAAGEALRILARRVLEHVYDGGTLRVEARLSEDRMIVEMAHAGGTVTATPPETHKVPAEDPRLRRVKALLAGIGGGVALDRQASGGLSARVTLAIAHN